jgi:GT2 family glycosyltransferase
MFSTAYFMYAEDVDICAKIRFSRRRVCYCDAAEVVHHGGVSSTRRGGVFLVHNLMRESIALLMTKFKGEAYARSYRTAMGIAAFVRLLLLAGAVPVMVLSGSVACLRLRIEKWWTVLAWACGRRVMNTPNNGETECRRVAQKRTEGSHLHRSSKASVGIRN